MKDFKDWDEVKGWLLKGEQVFYWTWTYSEDWMSCGDSECSCEDTFDTVADAIKSLRRYCSDRLEMVERL